MATIEIRDRDLLVHIHGWDKLLSLRSTITVPFDHINSAKSHPVVPNFDDVPNVTKIMGGGWPHVFIAGTFSVNGEIVFYDVHDSIKAIEIELTHEKIKRIVVEVDDESPDAAVARIHKAIGR